MADAEVEILLTLTTQITKSLDEAKKSIEGTTNSLLAVGNAASSVDSIFSSLTSISLRLENAHERLANAEDRLEDAQTRLNRLQKSGKATSEQLEDAQKDLDRTTRGLTIAQNNLARAQNQVIGTYINVGIQAVRLIQSLPKLKKAIDDIRLASQAFVVTPLGLALLAIGTAIAAVTLTMNSYKESQQKIDELNDRIKVSNKKLSDSFTTIRDEQNKTIDQLLGRLEQKSEEELSVERKLLLAKRGLREDGTAFESELEREGAEKMAQVRLNSLQNLREIKRVETELSRKDDSENAIMTEEILKMPYEAWTTYLTDVVPILVQQSVNETNRIVKAGVDADIAELDRLEKKRISAYGGVVSGKNTVASLVSPSSKATAIINANPVEMLAKQLSKNLFNRGK